MNIRTIAVLVCCVSLCTSTNAQKSKIKEAKSALSLQPPALEEARTAIDAAVAETTTVSSAEAWYVRGQVYFALGTDERTKAACSGCLETAHSSFLRAEELDAKKQYVLEIESQRIPAIIQAVFDNGVAAFTKEDYAAALACFEFVIRLSPNEMVAVQNAAFAADNAGDWVKAEKYYRTLIGTKEGTDKTYSSLARILLQQKDTTAALVFLKQGRTQYPDSMGLLLSEINIHLASGDDTAATIALEEAVRKDPSNASVYLAMGSVYETMARPKEEDASKPLSASSKELMAKARKAYEDGLKVDPENFDLNFNLAAFLFNRGTELENLANAQRNDAEFQRLKKESQEYYRAAEPYFEKDLQLKPDDESVLNSLKMLYFRTKEDAKYNQIKARLDALK